MHELAHLVIGHRPGRIDITEDGTLMLQTYDRQQEDEANWLAGCLLLPRPALMFIEQQGLEANSAARVYGVSTQMLQYRRQVTGVQYQMRRRHASTRE
jgi:Zn-dependent peptidase ImmA (M78 family)